MRLSATSSEPVKVPLRLAALDLDRTLPLVVCASFHEPRALNKRKMFVDFKAPSHGRKKQ
jgi:hypothetical protein